MKIKLIACLLINSIFFSIPDHANAQEFKVGDNVLSLGLGLGSSLGGYSYSSQTPAISIQFEHGQWDVGGPGTISLGGYLGFKSFKYAYPTFYSQKWSYTVIGIRSAYHYNGLNIQHLDVYGGVMLSYNVLSYTYESNNSFYDNRGGNYPSALGFSIYIGGKYYFSSNVAGFLELGYGISYATIGGSYKF